MRVIAVLLGGVASCVLCNVLIADSLSPLWTVIFSVAAGIAGMFLVAAVIDYVDGRTKP